MSQRIDNIKLLQRDLKVALYCSGKALWGGAWTPVAGITLGLWKTANKQAAETRHSAWVFSKPFAGVIKVINPKTIARANENDTSLFNNIPKKLLGFGLDCANSQSCLKRYVISRGAFFLGALTAVITGIFDMILAIPATALALITFGCSARINQTAIEQLIFPEALYFIGVGLRKWVNPHPRR